MAKRLLSFRAHPVFYPLLVTGWLVSLPGLCFAENFISGQISYFQNTSSNFQIPAIQDDSHVFTDSGAYSKNYILEIGMSDLDISKVMRISFAWTRMEQELDKLSVGMTNYTGFSTTSSMINRNSTAIGLGTDNPVNLFTINFHYDYPQDAGFQPFINIGAGIADMDYTSNKEPVFTLSLGGRYQLGDSLSLDFRYQNYKVNGAVEHLGIRYENTLVDSLSATIGMDF